MNNEEWRVAGPYPSVTVCNVLEGGELEFVARLWDWQDGEAPEEVKKQAHLIAAAPDMLAELMSLRQEFMSLFLLAEKADQPIHFRASALEKFVAEIDGVIAKSKGGAS